MKPKLPRPKKCKVCQIKFQPERTMQPCCSIKCAIAKVEKDKDIKRKKELAAIRKKEKEFKLETNRRKKAVIGRDELLNKLQKLVNQWVLHVRDKDKPCCTCGKSDPSIKYDAGHYRSRGACQELRFELTNIHKQCSVNCNGWGSGMRKEYRDFIEHYYSKEHLEWLDGKHPLLKDVFADNNSIDTEIDRYRKLVREAGLKPIR